MIKLWRFLSIPIILAVCLGLVLVPGLVSGQPPKDCWLEIDPALTEVGFNEAFDVNVTFNNPNGTDISAIGCHINFTASLLEVTGVDCGATVGSPFVFTLIGPSWDNATGWLDYDACCQTLTTTNVTSCVFATIHMKSKGASGTAALEFVPAIGGDLETGIVDTMSNDHLNWSMVVNGTVIVLAAPPPVGGTVYPVNKLAILAPWIALAVLLAGGLSWLTLRRRRA